jgi:hypothetical protein
VTQPGCCGGPRCGSESGSGQRSSVGVHVGVATTDRHDLPAQDENLRSIDVAVPAEFLLSDPTEREQAQRLRRATCDTRDVSRRAGSAPGSPRRPYAGVLGGAHVRYGVLHLVRRRPRWLYVPKSSLHGVTYGGRLTVMPTVGALLRIGT